MLLLALFLLVNGIYTIACSLACSFCLVCFLGAVRWGVNLMVVVHASVHFFICVVTVVLGVLFCLAHVQ